VSLFRILPIIAVGVAVFLGKDAFKENLNVVGKVQNAATSGIEVDAIADMVMTEFLENTRLPVDDFSTFLRENSQVGKGNKEGRDRTKDPWGTPYKLKVVQQGYEVLSAGPDAQWGTEDDLKAARSLKEVPGGLAVTPDSYDKKAKPAAAMNPSKPVVSTKPANGSLPRQTAEETERKVLEFHIRQAESGAPAFQYELGLRYLEGRGVELNAAKGREWLEKAAQGGNQDAVQKLKALDAGKK
jgi:hypothetical protein